MSTRIITTTLHNTPSGSVDIFTINLSGQEFQLISAGPYFTFYPSAIPAIKLLNDTNLLAIVVTNQSHITKGFFTFEYFSERMETLKKELWEGGARLDAVYCCPHETQDNCSCQKPKPGMLFEAQKDFYLDLRSCYVVGDVGAWDLGLTTTTHCKGVLVRTGLGESSLGEYRHTWEEIHPDYIADDILGAVRWIIDDIRQVGK